MPVDLWQLFRTSAVDVDSALPSRAPPFTASPRSRHDNVTDTRPLSRHPGRQQLSARSRPPPQLPRVRRCGKPQPPPRLRALCSAAALERMNRIRDGAANSVGGRVPFRVSPRWTLGLAPKTRRPVPQDPPRMSGESTTIGTYVRCHEGSYKILWFIENLDLHAVWCDQREARGDSD